MSGLLIESNGASNDAVNSEKSKSAFLLCHESCTCTFFWSCSCSCRRRPGRWWPDGLNSAQKKKIGERKKNTKGNGLEMGCLRRGIMSSIVPRAAGACCARVRWVGKKRKARKEKKKRKRAGLGYPRDRKKIEEGAWLLTSWLGRLPRFSKQQSKQLLNHNSN